MHRAHDRHGPIVDGHVYDLKNPSRTGAKPARFNPHGAGRISSQPTTMDDLQRRTGRYYGRAVVHAEWSAISTWMMRGEATSALEAQGIPYQVASVAARLVREAKEHAKGWPSHSGKDATPLLYGLSSDCRHEAKRTAYEVYRVWQEQGRPCLSARLIEDAYQHLAAAVRQGLLNPIPGLSAEPLTPTNFKLPMCAEFLDRLGTRMKEPS